MKTHCIAIVTFIVMLSCNQDTIASGYFDGTSSDNLEFTLKKAKEKKMPIFMVIYDARNPTKSQLDYSLGYFLQYKTTRDLVRKNFLQVLVKSSNRGVAMYIPKNDPLENCLIVVLSPDGEALVTQSAYANPDVGMERVGEYIAKWEMIKKKQEQQEKQKKPELPTKVQSDRKDTVHKAEPKVNALEYAPSADLWKIKAK